MITWGKLRELNHKKIKDKIINQPLAKVVEFKTIESDSEIYCIINKKDFEDFLQCYKDKNKLRDKIKIIRQLTDI